MKTITLDVSDESADWIKRKPRSPAMTVEEALALRPDYDKLLQKEQELMLKGRAETDGRKADELAFELIEVRKKIVEITDREHARKYLSVSVGTAR